MSFSIVYYLVIFLFSWDKFAFQTTYKKNLNMNIDKMTHLIFLVKTENTGTPKELSQKIQLSERMLYNYLKILKVKIHAPICYNSIKNTYYFSEPGTLNWEWTPQKAHSEVFVG